MNGNQKILILVILIILLIALGISIYITINKLESLNQDNSSAFNNIETETNQNQLQFYSGQFYTFSYPKDWDIWEANSLLGLTILYPKTKTEQVMNKTISTTDEITLGIVDGKIDTRGTQEIIINGQSWFVKTSDKPFDGGTENGIEYLRAMTTNKYIDIATGVSNKDILAVIVKSFNSKLK